MKLKELTYVSLLQSFDKSNLACEQALSGTCGGGKERNGLQEWVAFANSRSTAFFAIFP